MNNEVVTILTGHMGLPPDDLISLDKAYHEAEAEAEHDPEKIAVLEFTFGEMATVLMDESLSHTIRIGFVLSTAALAQAALSNIPLTQIYANLTKAAIEAETQRVVRAKLYELLNAPNCPECGISAAWCASHEVWECRNIDCPHTGAIEG